MRALLCLTAVLVGPVLAAGQAMQRPQDQAAFLRARAVAEPEARLAALKGFATEYPATALAKRAEALELETLLANFPERTVEVHALAAAAATAAPAGFERWSEEARLADALASAGPSGADLVDATAWAKDATGALNEESYRRQMRLMEVRYKLPPLTAGQRHREYVRTRASFLAALANVDLRAKDSDGAGRALAEAVKLDPLSSEVSSLQGQVALGRRDDTTALADFERAEAEGDLKEPCRGEMLRLYERSHGGAGVPGWNPDRWREAKSEGAERDEVPSGEVPSDKGPDAESGRFNAEGGDLNAEVEKLNAEIDVLYAKLFPPPFALAPRRLPAGGHTALLELFTGAGCEPCIAPDLAVESLLGTYGRQDLVVLEFDEHIPRPDPLANPAAGERAAMYGVGQTPSAFLDGDEIPVGGASRADVENVVVGLADALETRAAVATGLKLALKVTWGAGGALAVAASVARDGMPPTGGVALPKRAVLRVALVEDHVRYSGENGIRFHRMVVRAVAPERIVETMSANASNLSFDPAGIARDQLAYLSAFEKNNDRFGDFRFRSTEIPIRADQLAVAAWVEDPGTHEVLEAAFKAVPKL